MKDELAEERARIAKAKRVAEVAKYAEEIKRMRPIWEAEAAIDEECEKTAEEIKAFWTKQIGAQNEHGFALKDAYVLLTVDDVRAIVLAVAKDFARDAGYDFPVRNHDATLHLQDQDFAGYVSRSAGFITHYLRTGAFVATGLNSRNPTKRVKISADSWNALTLNFADSKASTDAFSYLGVRITKPVVSPESKASPVAELTIKKWLEGRKPEWDSAGYPDRDTVEVEVRAALGRGVSRPVIRRLFNAIKPPERQGRGRPRKNGQQ